MKTIALPAEITPEWLTTCLRQATGSDAIVVSAVRIARTWQSIVSSLATIEVTYASGGGAALPGRLFVKTRKPDAPAKVGPREVLFYSRVAGSGRRTPTPRCYGSSYDEATGNFHILLDDLSETHSPVCEWPMAPVGSACEGIIDAFAEHHGTWWSNAELLDAEGGAPSEEKHRAYAQWMADSFARFADFMQDRLSPRRRGIYERALGAIVKVRQRLWRRGFTLTHGDAHVWNVMYPRHEGGAVYIIDWDLWRPGPAAIDLAYMIALFWFPERRAIYERPLLRRYCDGLARAGVSGYGFEELWEDYRLAVVQQLAAPLWQQTHKINAGLWWPHFERITSAYEDLGCDEVLASLD